MATYILTPDKIVDVRRQKTTVKTVTTYWDTSGKIEKTTNSTSLTGNNYSSESNCVAGVYSNSSSEQTYTNADSYVEKTTTVVKYAKTLLHFPTSEIIGTITSAVLRLRPTLSGADRIKDFSITKMTSSWTSSSATWSNTESIISSIGVSQVHLAKSTWNEIDVTDIYNSYGYCISDVSGLTGDRYFNKTGNYAPQLVVTTDATDKKLIYNANGGSGAPSEETKTGSGSVTFTVSNTSPSREHYTFLGWSKNKNDSVATYHSGDTISTSSNITVYAIWQGDSMTIKWNKNDGSGTYVTTTMRYGDQIGSFPEIVRLGYEFGGWTTTNSGEEFIDEETIPDYASTIEYYAQWKIISLVHIVKKGKPIDGFLYVIGDDNMPHKGSVYVMGTDNTLHPNA